MVVVNTTDMWSAAATVFVVVAISAFMVIAIWEHHNRQVEHQVIEGIIRTENESVRQRMDAVICTTKLNLFLQTLPKGQPIVWQDIPAELWPCTPKTFIEERKTLK